MARIIIALFLLLPGAPGAYGAGTHYFITIHNGSYNFKGGAGQLEESHKALREMVKLADAQHVRLTLMFSAQYAGYIASDPVRLAELEGWKETGHEIGAYHAGPDMRVWDGYSDMPADVLSRARKDYNPALKVWGHREYFAALGRLEPGIKTGCMMGGVDKKFSAAGPAYETCSKPENRGNAAAGSEGINYYLTATGNKKKLLSCSRPTDREGSAASKKAFLGMASGVYGVSFRSSPSEFGAFYAWLEFLRSVDPQGSRNRTVSGIVEGKLLPEKKGRISIANGAAGKWDVPARPEPVKTVIPRIRPAYLHRQADIIIFKPPRQANSTEQGGYCGDGICNAFERSHSGSCLRDCGK